MTQSTEGERSNLSHIATMRFSDFENHMAEVHGPRFVEYRQDFHNSLNYDKNGFLPEFPITLQLELINRCNLSCVMCYTTNHKTPKETLDIGTVRKMMQEAKQYKLPALMIGMGAESLLYKDIRSLVEAAQDAEVMDIFFATNGVLLNESMAEFLVKKQVARCWISLDAATPETFKKIRGKDELDKIEANIRRLVEIKRREKSKLPNLRVSFCVQEHNFHERAAFVEKWKDTVDHIDFQQLTDFKFLDELMETGDVVQKPEVPANVDLERPVCQYPFNSLNVWSSGDVTPCCNFYGKSLVVGNVREQSLKEIWDGAALNEIRDQFRTGNINPTCRVCLCSRDQSNFGAAKETAKAVNAVARQAAE